MENKNIILNKDFSLVPYSFPNSYDGLKKYAYSIPNLSEKEERFLLEDYKYNNSIDSAHKLVLSQLKTVFSIVEEYKNYGIPKEELLQEGNIGLMKAVKKYDINQKVRLYTYALVWIKSEIQSFIIKNYKIIKVATTNNLKKLFFNFRKTQQEMISLGENKNNLITSIVKKFEVTEEEARQMQEYFSNDDYSIDFDDPEHPVFQIPDYSQSPEKQYIKNIETVKIENKISKALNNLDEREKYIINSRFYLENKKTNKELAKELNISSERVRQIEEKALSKIKDIIKSN